LAKENVGKYVNTHFVSAFQKVATFQINGNQKQGGNVASYFCTPDGLVLHAIAGPVNDDVFLREARWTIETYNLALLDKNKTTAQLRAAFQKAHVDRLQNEHGINPTQLTRQVRMPLGKSGPKNGQGVNPSQLLLSSVTVETLGMVVDQQRHRGLGNQGKVHLLLTVAPLPRIEMLYHVVFEKILNERVSTTPVVVAGR